MEDTSDVASTSDCVNHFSVRETNKSLSRSHSCLCLRSGYSTDHGYVGKSKNERTQLDCCYRHESTATLFAPSEAHGPSAFPNNTNVFPSLFIADFLGNSGNASLTTQPQINYLSTPNPFLVRTETKISEHLVDCSTKESDLPCVIPKDEGVGGSNCPWDWRLVKRCCLALMAVADLVKNNQTAASSGPLELGERKWVLIDAPEPEVEEEKRNGCWKTMSDNDGDKVTEERVFQDADTYSEDEDDEYETTNGKYDQSSEASENSDTTNETTRKDQTTPPPAVPKLLMEEIVALVARDYLQGLPGWPSTFQFPKTRILPGCQDWQDAVSLTPSLTQRSFSLSTSPHPSPKSSFNLPKVSHVPVFLSMSKITHSSSPQRAGQPPRRCARVRHCHRRNTCLPLSSLPTPSPAVAERFRSILKEGKHEGVRSIDAEECEGGRQIERVCKLGRVGMGAWLGCAGPPGEFPVGK